jgi:MFS family permease
LNENIQRTKLPILAGFKQTFSSRSAIGCLVGIMLFYTTYAQSVYLVSFWKQVFAITTSIGALTIVVNASISAVGSIVAGRLVNKIGRKTIVVITGFIESVFVAFTFFMPTFLLSWVFSMVRIWWQQSLHLIA